MTNPIEPKPAATSPRPKSSKRIRRFRESMIKEIPKFPNNKEAKHALEAMPLTDLLIIYMAWRLRLVAPRARTVIGAEKLSADPRAASLRPNIQAFFDAVERGDDLTPYLSLRAVEKGFALPGAGQKLPTWDDKDFVLNVFRLHHFHLGLAMVNDHIDRTDDVLFAAVDRDQLVPLALFDHTVFEMEATTMTPERERLWRLGEDYVGGFGGVTGTGTPIQVTLEAIKTAQIIEKLDPKLDDRSWIMETFKPDGPPSSVKPAWCFRHLDLGIMDTRRNLFVRIQPGPT